VPMTVSALMATTNKRAAFRPRALECFKQQIFPADWEVDLIVDEHETNTLGRKLNDMVARTTAEFLITLDDDDWHSHTRIARQIAPLVTGEYSYSGTSKIFYHNIITDEGWLYSGTPRIWLGGLAFARSVWEKQKFRDITVGVDTRWQQLAQAEHKAKFFDVADPALFIASMHPGNSCPKHTTTCSWKPATLPEFTRL
jgi:hypothetical protein